PAGIPDFTLAKEQVASGRKPILDGVDWLREKGYRTVLHLRSLGEDDSEDRKMFEARGLVYISLEVSPETLSPAVVQQFNKIVVDPANLPLFVYDKEGALSGALWYLHFRTIEKARHEDALTRASRLGLKEDQTGAQRSIWLAIQKYLAEQSGK